MLRLFFSLSKLPALLFLCFIALFSCGDEIEQMEAIAKDKLLTININRIPADADEQIMLYHVEGAFHDVWDSIRIMPPRMTMKFNVPSNIVGSFNLGEHPQADFLIGTEDSIAITCNYKSLKDHGNLLVQSKENELYSEAKEIMRQQSRKEDEIRLKHQINNGLYLSKEGYELLEKTRAVYNFKYDSFSRMAPGSYFSEVVAPMLKTPVRNKENWGDGYPDFLHQHYFRDVPLDRRDILNSIFFNQFVYNYANYYKGNEPMDYIRGTERILEAASMHPEVRTFIRDAFLDYYIQTGKVDIAKGIALIGDEGCSDDLLAEIDAGAEFYKGLPLGETVPNIELPNFNLHAELAGHPLNFLYFWKSGCTQCEQEHQNILKHHEQLSKLGIHVMGFALDDNENKFKETLRQYKLPWKNVSDFKGTSSNYVETFRIKSTPSTFIINNENILIEKQIPIENLLSMIQQ